jgi:maleate isomerase
MSWRARLGVIIPADGVDEEFWRLSPDGVSVHITRISTPPGKITIQKIDKHLVQSNEIEKAAQNLKLLKPDAIGYGCTSGSFIHGVKSDLAIIDRMENASGVPCTTTSTASVKAFKKLGVNKIALATPYSNDVNNRLIEYFEGNEIEIVNLETLDITDNVFFQPVEVTYHLCKKTDVSEAQAIFVACTALRTLDILETIESDVGKPVVSAVQATMWELLNLAKVSTKGYGIGSLFN